MGERFTVTQTVTTEIERGWGVWFIPLWDEREDGSDFVSDVDGGVIEIAPETVREVGGVLCAVDPETPNFGVPVENFERREDLWTDDTHDFRERFFETREEAKAHLTYTLERFANPSPWESFVKL